MCLWRPTSWSLLAHSHTDRTAIPFPLKSRDLQAGRTPNCNLLARGYARQAQGEYHRQKLFLHCWLLYTALDTFSARTLTTPFYHSTRSFHALIYDQTEENMILKSTTEVPVTLLKWCHPLLRTRALARSFSQLSSLCTDASFLHTYSRALLSLTCSLLSSHCKLLWYLPAASRKTPDPESGFWIAKVLYWSVCWHWWLLHLLGYWNHWCFATDSISGIQQLLPPPLPAKPTNWLSSGVHPAEPTQKTERALETAHELRVTCAGWEESTSFCVITVGLRHLFWSVIMSHL